MRELKVLLMGSFALVDDPPGVPAAALLRKAQDLIALVLVAPQNNVLRETAAEALWPDAEGEASKKAMRQTLWQIHHAIDPDVDESSRLLVTEGETLHLNPDRQVWVDTAELTDAARTAQTLGVDGLADPQLADLAVTAELYRGPLLARCYDEWCLAPRARLEDRSLTLMDTLSRAYDRRGDLRAAIGWAERLLGVEPAHERSHRRLMRLYYRTGDRTRALRQLNQCRWVLEHELGVRPSVQTEELAAAIVDDRVPGVEALRDPPSDARERIELTTHAAPKEQAVLVVPATVSPSSISVLTDSADDRARRFAPGAGTAVVDDVAGRLAALADSPVLALPVGPEAPPAIGAGRLDAASLAAFQAELAALRSSIDAMSEQLRQHRA